MERGQIAGATGLHDRRMVNNETHGREKERFIDTAHWLGLWLPSYLMTLALETPIFVLFAYRAVGIWQGALAGMAGTVITHPLLWFVWRPFVYGLLFDLADRPWFRDLLPGALREASHGRLTHDLVYPLYIAR
jgi:hypothetical protein